MHDSWGRTLPQIQAELLLKANIENYYRVRIFSNDGRDYDYPFVVKTVEAAIRYGMKRMRKSQNYTMLIEANTEHYARLKAPALWRDQRAMAGFEITAIDKKQYKGISE